MFDIVASAVALIFLCPVFLAIALTVMADSKGPVFFRQWRVGRKQKLFRVYKFRTMVDGAGDRGPPITVAGDGRVTAVGRLLRRFELDELPTLVNVLKGEMSIVGPRPELPKYLPYYEEKHKRIFLVRPGMTDLGTLKFRDEARLLPLQGNAERVYVERILPEKLKLSLEYVERRSILFDLSVILRTFALIAARSKG